VTNQSQYIADLETQDLILRSKIEELTKDKENLERCIAWNDAVTKRMWRTGGIRPYTATVNVDTGREGITDKIDFYLSSRSDILDFLMRIYPRVFSNRKVVSISLRRSTFSVTGCSNLVYTLHETPRLATNTGFVTSLQTTELIHITKLFRGFRVPILTVPNIESRKTMDELVKIVIDYLDVKQFRPGG